MGMRWVWKGEHGDNGWAIMIACVVCRQATGLEERND